MLTAEESAELRTLQARAYGQDAELSAADAARLRELERRSDAEAFRDDAEPLAAAAAWPVTAPSTAGASSLEHAELAGTRASSDSPATRRPGIRPWIAVLAVIVVFALGAGFGWMLFGQPDRSSIGLTQEQRARGAEIVANGTYDANSLRAMIEREGVMVWLATTDAGESLCLIVDDGADATAACNDEDRVAFDGLVVVHQSIGDGYTDVAHATLLLTAGREPAVHLDVQRTDE